MTRLESNEPDSVEGSEFKQEEFAARFLLRALQELRLVDDTITVEDLQTVADEVMKDMDLMIGSEEFLRELFDVTNQVDFYNREAYYKTVADLSEKITQSQINLAKNDRDSPF